MVDFTISIHPRRYTQNYFVEFFYYGWVALDPTYFWIEDSSWNRVALNGIQRIACFMVFLHNLKIRNLKKIWNLVFLSIQPIPDLSCKFDIFWKNKFLYFDVADLFSKMIKFKKFTFIILLIKMVVWFAFK